ncbi:hypothetical protein BJY04DRAFT_229992 [Aspergillus karnatakaensis]|uniref:uncharacterized protein n=1 Tax=Aspergillus karnatakaensis TaxID=1810916 RepID=UPI003CCD267E
MSLFGSCALAAYIYITSSLFFDTAHFFLHRWTRSRYKPLQWLARCHSYHHLYYSHFLNFNDRYRWKNACVALPLEMVCLCTGALLGWLSLQLLSAPSRSNGTSPLTAVVALHIIRLFVVICMGGRDSNHVTYETVPKDHHWLLVGPQFHALHHVYPSRYMGSITRIFDWIAGTAYILRGKTVAITGGSGAFGRAIIRRLHAEGVENIYTLKFGRDWTHDNFRHVASIFEQKRPDILILAHGTKGGDAMDANFRATAHIIRLYMKSTMSQKNEPKARKTLPEIWYVGSEIELHPAFGGPEMHRYLASKRAFLPYARALYDDTRVIYRHIVPAAFHSPMGKALVSADWAAGCMMWWIRRGAQYVPVTYTGLAYLNFFKFVFWVRPRLLGEDWDS